MDSFLFTLALFAFWGLVGFATISVFSPRLRVIQGVLISPAIGVAVTILPVFFINRLGIPVKDFGGLLFLALATLAVVAMVIKRPIFPLRRLLPFLGILLVALLLVARPMLSYGFDWVSFSNDDMANYCLGAERFLNHGFFDQPNLDELFGGKDYSLAYWFMHVAAGVRSGSELMLAFVWAFSGLNAHQVFMPVIMALHLALVAVTGAMVSGIGTSKKTPMIAMWFMAISPLTTLGSLYQLIGQVGGLALLGAVVTFMYRPRSFKLIPRSLLGLIPAVMVFSAIFIWYPEVLPFFGLGWVLYVLLLLRRDKQKAVKVIVPSLLVGALVLVTLNKYVVNALIFMLGQASGGMQSADLSTVLFPYFLVPSGIAALWGLIPIAGNIHEPFVSLAILGGLLLIYWMARYIVPKQIKSVTVPVSMVLVMSLMGLLLFFRNNDFGLFKLAMFVQPYLIGVAAIGLASLSWKSKSWLLKTSLLIIVVPMAISQLGYVGKSTGEIFGGLNEIPRASAQKVNRQFENLFLSLRNEKNDGYIADTSNIVLAKFQSFYTQGESLIFPSRNFFVNIADMALKGSFEASGTLSRYDELKNGQFLEHQVETSGGSNKFLMIKDAQKNLSGRTLITTLEKQTVFNSAYSADGNEYFQAVKSPHNHLVFVHSDKGNHYYFGDRKKIAFYQLENDPMFPGQKFSAIGEQLLFFVIGPSQKPRVVMELTDTVVKQFGSELPKPKVQNASINFAGRGSGRVFSEPIEFTKIDGMSFMSIDMNRSGQQFPNAIKGLMLLYGREVPADQRRITAFARNISLISEEQYKALNPPTSLNDFPADLVNKDLEYSGIYEDGWISERSFFVLKKEAGAKYLVIRGMMPQINTPTFTTTLRVSIDGVQIAQKAINLGQFEIKIPLLNVQDGRRRIDLSFDAYQTLPGADGRPTGGKIDFIGFDQN